MLKKKHIHVFLLYTILILPLTLMSIRIVPADTIVLNNGKIVKGRILEDEEKSITILTPTMSFTLLKKNIKEIKKDTNRSKSEILGDIAFEDSRYNEALSYYKNALMAASDKKDKECIQEKIDSLHEVQEKEAKRRFGNQLNQADKLINLKRFDEAEALLRQIINNLPDQSLAKPVNDKMAYLFYRKALEYKNTVNDLKSVEALKKSIEFSDETYQAHFMYADLLFKSARTQKQAISHYLQGIANGEKHISKEKIAHYHRKIALLYENSGNFTEAIKNHKRILELDPVSYPDTKSRIVNSYLYLAIQLPVTEFDKRKAFLLKALETDQYSVQAHFILASLYYENNYIDESLKEFKELLKINPRMPEGHYYLAMCYQKQKSYAKEKESLDKELSINPGSYRALCSLGDYLLKGGKYEQSISNYEKAQKLSQEKYRAYIGLARAYKKLENSDKAREYLNEIFKSNPDHIEATILSGSLHKDSKEYKEARELFNNVVTRLEEKGNLNHPEIRTLLIEALNQRGELNLILNSPRIATADFKESLKYEPDFPKTFYLMAQAYEKIGNFKEAEKNYIKAQELDPESPDFFLGLAIMYHNNLKLKKKAIENYTEYIQLGGEDFEKVNEWIKECGGKPVKHKSK
jgi:tetratricopeptide (TPR) repeat protein